LLTYPCHHVCRCNDLDQAWWENAEESNSFSHLKFLNGEHYARILAFRIKLEAGELDELDINGTGLFYNILRHLEKCASRLKTLNFRLSERFILLYARSGERHSYIHNSIST
jgi:hypothetical protein